MGGSAGFLAGREASLAALMAAIADGRSVAVVGEAGIGKTSLVRAGVAQSGRRIVEGGAFATLTWAPYLALRRAVGGMSGNALGGDPTSVAAAVERHVGPDLLFIDDLQWADSETRATLDLLFGRIGIVCAIREGDPGTAAALDAARRLEMEVIGLAELTPADARILVARLRPDLGAAGVARIVAAGGGNPLLLEELALRGSSPVLTRGLEARLDALGIAARRTVELLAVADRPLPKDRLGEPAAELVRNGLALERDGAIEVRHALLAEAIRAGLAGRDLAKIHRRAAEFVEDPAEIARHLAAGGQRKAAGRMANAALASVTDPRARSALLVIAVASARPTEALQLRLQAARALDQVSDWEAVLSVLTRDGPAEGGTPDELTERDALLAHACYELGRVDEARGHLALASRRGPDPGGSAAAQRAVETATLMINVDGAVPQALGLLAAQAALQVPGSLGRRDLDALFGSIAMLATGAGDITHLREAADDAFASGRYRTAADRARVVQFALLLGEGAEPALDYVVGQEARFRSAGVIGVALEFLAESIHAAILAGRLADAVTRADELLEQPAPARARQSAAIFRARALTLLGRFEAAAEGLLSIGPTLTPDYFGSGEALLVQAELALWSGLPARAMELVDRMLTIAPPVPSAHIPPQVVRAWGAWEAGQPIPPFASVPVRSVAGAAPETEGLRLLEAGGPDAAAASFHDAASLWAGFHRSRELVCQWAEGESLRRAGRVDEATAVLQVTLDSAVAIGFEPLAARLRRSLRQSGVRVASAPRGSAVGPLDLTRRERELVELVELGLTNVEIARRLGLGRPTVARMLASAMAKVGAERRAQLAGAVRGP